MVNKQHIESAFKKVQDYICEQLTELDGSGVQFQEDLWTRPEGGGGRTRVFKGGDVLEKGGVNFSAVEGPMPPMLQKHLKLEEGDFFATGVSIVLHPQNPWCPIIHMNIRYFEAGDVYWFGGGIDMTPHYIVPEEAKQFHHDLKAICDQHHPDFYAKHKKEADEYFFIPHRNETRGIGGVFFDHLSHKNTDLSKEDLLQYCVDLGMRFPHIWAKPVKANRNKPYSDRDKKWQLIRRGRYVEFNLVWDRGTKFGLETNGRIESILMSLPELASWEYNFETISSEEQFTLDHLTKDQDWLNYGKNR